jgi:predicted small lipoprotein YifL
MRRKRSGCLLLLMLMLLSLAGCGKNGPKQTDTVAPEGMKEESSGKLEEKDSDYKNTNGKEEEQDISGDRPVIKDSISLFPQEAFLPEDTEIKIEASKTGRIYYTLDGSDPDETQLLYEKPILLQTADTEKVVSVKAKAYFEDGSQSETVVRTYFTGKDIAHRYSTLIFSVTSDPYNLYDYEYGILVEGKLRDDYIKANPRAKIEPPTPANYNMRGRESEREVYLEVFEADGSKIAAQAAGIRVYGGWSRANLQKSIKIYTRKDYDKENNKLRYEFFPWKITTEGKPADAFNRLVLRNSGNDNGFGFIRDELFQTLAGQAGFMDYEAVRPAVLYINGDYRGVFWLHEVYGDDYFDENYGNFDGEFQILEGGDTYKLPDEDGGNEQYIAEYDAIYWTYANQDLTDDAVYEDLCRVIDVENYLSYFALQAYIGNEDWPHNNYKTYRYYAAEGEAYREAPFDGKWRYLLHDLDFSFGIYGTRAWVDNIWRYVGANGEIREECPLFSQLMRREDCKEFFITKTMDLINGAFSPENLNKVLNEMHQSRIKEQANMYDKNLLASWVQFDQLEDRMEEIRSYGEERAGYIPASYRRHFKLGDLYQLSVQPAEGCGVQINSLVTENLFKGSYFTDYPTVITPIIPEGKEFKCWQVNGKTYQTEELIITPAMLKDLKAEVICMIK